MEGEPRETGDAIGHIKNEGITSLIGRRLNIMKTTFVDDALSESGHVMKNFLGSGFLKADEIIEIRLYKREQT